jgi:hypothetical protein
LRAAFFGRFLGVFSLVRVFGAAGAAGSGREGVFGVRRNSFTSQSNMALSPCVVSDKRRQSAIASGF